MEKKPGSLPVLPFLLGVLLAVSVGATVLVLVSFGLGSVLAKVLPFTTFEATLLVLLAGVAAGATIWRVLENLEDREVDEAWGDWPEDDLATSERGADLADVALHDLQSPNGPCPCRSGKKYKRCCGAKKAGVS